MWGGVSYQELFFAPPGGDQIVCVCVCARRLRASLSLLLLFSYSSSSLLLHLQRLPLFSLSLAALSATLLLFNDFSLSPLCQRLHLSVGSEGGGAFVCHRTRAETSIALVAPLLLLWEEAERRSDAQIFCVGLA